MELTYSKPPPGDDIVDGWKSGEKTTVWMVLKALKINGINYLAQLVQDFSHQQY